MNTMEELIDFYNSRISTYTTVLERLVKQIRLFGTLRLLVFCGATIMLWLTRHTGWMIPVAITTAFAVLFVALVVVHAGLYRKKAYTQTMIRLNVDELRCINYDFSAFDGAPEAIDHQHAFGPDLDLFGNASLFQSLNRTVVASGKSLLRQWFENPLTDANAIRKRQKAVQEMAAKALFRQHFYVAGSNAGHADDAAALQKLSARQACFSTSIVWKAMVWVIPALWIAVSAGVFCGIFPYSAYGLTTMVALIVGNVQSLPIQRLYIAVDKMEKRLLTYAELIGLIENEPFDSAELLDAQRVFCDGNMRVSGVIKRLSKMIHALDQRFSLAGIVLNLLAMRDMRQAMKLEKWISAHAGNFGKWFDALARVDAFCSLGGFAFNHPDYVYPELTDTYFEMVGKDLGHPLLHRDECVKNDVSITQSPCFLIITGANMAGKSTYLRTVGINFVLACIGAPVCATALTVYPAQLFTSLHTTDSLTARESYFFAELKRLKAIIDRLHAGEKLFIILDEVLKGTNSKDKQTGSFALMKQLINLSACGIIATHDLLLGTLEDLFPEHTRNGCFEADITGDELTFTYRLRRGIAQNMNASFLMKQMGVTP